MEFKITEYPPCHWAKSSTERWEAQFESLFQNRNPITTAQGYFNGIVLEERLAPPNHHEEKLHEYVSLKQQLCGLQRIVSGQAAAFLVHNDLAAKWLEASNAVREKHVLIGIAAACGISPNLNKARLTCAKELRVSYLSGDGQILLDLLHAIAPQDLSEIPTEPQYVNNIEWDRLKMVHQDSRDEVKKLALQYIFVLRTKLIAHALLYIIRSFLGHKLLEVPVHKKGHTREKRAAPGAIEQLQKQAMIAAHGQERYDALMAESKAAYKQRTAKKVNACSGCPKEAGQREVFKKCAACWKINREVLYCSKACQVADWKPRHKLICGKLLDYDTATTLATIVPKTKAPSGFPSPTFKRPLELLIQMELLKEHPQYDYAVGRSVFTNNENIGMMVYTDPTARSRFLAHRDKAMTSGNRESVALICEYILWDFEVRKATDFCTRKVLGQISREYAYPVAELEESLHALGRIRSKVPGLRPILAYSDTYPDIKDSVLTQ